MIERWAIFVRK